MLPDSLHSKQDGVDANLLIDEGPYTGLCLSTEFAPLDYRYRKALVLTECPSNSLWSIMPTGGGWDRHYLKALSDVTDPTSRYLQLASDFRFAPNPSIFAVWSFFELSRGVYGLCSANMGRFPSGFGFKLVRREAGILAVPAGFDFPELVDAIPAAWRIVASAASDWLY